MLAYHVRRRPNIEPTLARGISDISMGISLFGWIGGLYNAPQTTYHFTNKNHNFVYIMLLRRLIISPIKITTLHDI